jgi:hypothetical protein
MREMEGKPSVGYQTPRPRSGRITQAITLTIAGTFDHTLKLAEELGQANRFFHAATATLS